MQALAEIDWKSDPPRARPTAAAALEMPDIEPDSRAFSLLILASLYAAYRTAGLVLARYGGRFGFSSLQNFASLPLLLLLMNVFSLIVTIGLSVGLAIAATALLPLSHALTGSVRPHVPLDQLAAILGGSALLALVALALPTRRALRTRPIEAIGLAE